MKTIGVLGGLGPQATMDFEARLHRAAQRRIPQLANGGYPPMVVYYCRHAPVLLDDRGEPRLPPQPDPRLLEAARRLGELADLLVIPSNGPHFFQDQIERASGRKVLSMIELTLEEVRRRGWRKVGVLGMGDPVVYTVPLAQRGMAFETLAPPRRAELNGAILRLMEGREGPDTAALARGAVAELRGRGVDGVVLGCTEIPLLLGADAYAPDLVDPAGYLAEAAVEAALG